jgi:isopenicillin N synthase-like dioxygenase
MSNKDHTIPIIDFEGFYADSASRRQEIVAEVDRVATEIGFMYAKNLSVDRALLEAAFASSAEFFNSSLEEKKRFEYQGADGNHGYQGFASERLDQTKPSDLKEAFTMRDVPRSIREGRDWPSGAYKDTAIELFNRTLFDANTVMEAFAEALDLPLDFFRKVHNGEVITLRYLHYPLVDTEPDEGQLGAGAHSDYGTVTLLYQDDVGGLEVMGTDGAWHQATYIPDTVVINTGDLMARWTNSKYCSTLHRVRPRTKSEAKASDRYSIAFFADPDNATPVSVLPSCQSAENPPKYADTTAGEHIQERIAASLKLAD